MSSLAALKRRATLRPTPIDEEASFKDPSVTDDDPVVPRKSLTFADTPNPKRVSLFAGADAGTQGSTPMRKRAVSVFSAGADAGTQGSALPKRVSVFSAGADPASRGALGRSASIFSHRDSIASSDTGSESEESWVDPSASSNLSALSELRASFGDKMRQTRAPTGPGGRRMTTFALATSSRSDLEYELQVNEREQEQVQSELKRLRSENESLRERVVRLTDANGEMQGEIEVYLVELRELRRLREEVGDPTRLTHGSHSARPCHCIASVASVHAPHIGACVCTTVCVCVCGTTSRIQVEEKKKVAASLAPGDVAWGKLRKAEQQVRQMEIENGAMIKRKEDQLKAVEAELNTRLEEARERELVAETKASAALQAIEAANEATAMAEQAAAETYNNKKRDALLASVRDVATDRLRHRRARQANGGCSARGWRPT